MPLHLPLSGIHTDLGHRLWSGMITWLATKLPDICRDSPTMEVTGTVTAPLMVTCALQVLQQPLQRQQLLGATMQPPPLLQQVRPLPRA